MADGDIRLIRYIEYGHIDCESLLFVVDVVMLLPLLQLLLLFVSNGNIIGSAINLESCCATRENYYILSPAKCLCVCVCVRVTGIFGVWLLLSCHLRHPFPTPPPSPHPNGYFMCNMYMVQYTTRNQKPWANHMFTFINLIDEMRLIVFCLPNGFLFVCVEFGMAFVTEFHLDCCHSLVR